MLNSDYEENLICLLYVYNRSGVMASSEGLHFLKERDGLLGFLWFGFILIDIKVQLSSLGMGGQSEFLNKY